MSLRGRRTRRVPFVEEPALGVVRRSYWMWLFVLSGESDSGGNARNRRKVEKKKRLRQRIKQKLDVDRNIDSGGKIQLLQFVDRLRCRLEDVDEPLVGPLFELLHRLLVDVR